MNPNSRTDNEQIISYQKLRNFIGVIGIFLPIALVLGCYIFKAGNDSWQHSISHYYYSKMHILFVCTLCVLGGFLITYKGKPNNPWESRVANIAGYCAFAVAAFPTHFDGFTPKAKAPNHYIEILQPVSELWGNIHFVFAAGLFLCFMLFCLVFFQVPDVNYNNVDMQKFKKRQFIYKFCGWGILVSIALIAIFHFGFKDRQGILTYTTFIFETTALWFFGTAWLVKGSIIWKGIPGLRNIIAPIR